MHEHIINFKCFNNKQMTNIHTYLFCATSTLNIYIYMNFVKYVILPTCYSIL